MTRALCFALLPLVALASKCKTEHSGSTGRRALLQLEGPKLSSIEVHLEQEQVEAADANELQHEVPDTIFTLLAQEVFDMTIVHCYKDSCTKFRPGGGAWPEKLQHKLIVHDGEVTDQDYAELLDRFATDESLISKRASTGGLHAAKGFLSHMVAIEAAHRLNLTSVLILEDDVIETEVSRRLSPSGKLQLVDRLGTELARIKWEGLKLTANYGYNTRSKEYQAYYNGTCRAPCKCVGQLALSSSQQDAIMCRTLKKQAGSSPCRFSNSAAYAVHKSAFPTWLKALEAVREMNLTDESLMGLAGHIDFWAAAAMDMWHVLPLLGQQDGKDGAVWKERRFRASCVDRRYVPY